MEGRVPAGKGRRAIVAVQRRDFDVERRMSALVARFDMDERSAEVA